MDQLFYYSCSNCPSSISRLLVAEDYFGLDQPARPMDGPECLPPICMRLNATLFRPFAIEIRDAAGFCKIETRCAGRWERRQDSNLIGENKNENETDHDSLHVAEVDARNTDPDGSTGCHRRAT